MTKFLLLHKNTRTGRIHVVSCKALTEDEALEKLEAYADARRLGEFRLVDIEGAYSVLGFEPDAAGITFFQE